MMSSGRGIKPDPMTHDFSQMLSVFLRNTDEKIRIIEAIESSVLSKIPSKDFFADLGCGDGTISSRVASKFKEYLCLDNNAENIKNTKEKLQNLPNGRIILADLNVYTPDFLADLILFSFSYGYIGMGLSTPDRLELWEKKFKNYYQTLTDTGVIVLVDACHDGIYSDFFKFMNMPAHDELGEFERWISDNYRTERYRIPVSNSASTLEEIIVILRLIAYDDGRKYLDRIHRFEEFARKLPCNDEKICFNYDIELMFVENSDWGLSDNS